MLIREDRRTPCASRPLCYLPDGSGGIAQRGFRRHPRPDQHPVRGTQSGDGHMIGSILGCRTSGPAAGYLCPAAGQITSLAAKITDWATPRTNVQQSKRAKIKNRLRIPPWVNLPCRKEIQMGNAGLKCLNHVTLPPNSLVTNPPSGWPETVERTRDACFPAHRTVSSSRACSCERSLNLHPLFVC